MAIWALVQYAQGGEQEEDVAACGLCGGRGFLPTGVVRRFERLSIANGRPTVVFQRFNVLQPCPVCRATGKRKATDVGSSTGSSRCLPAWFYSCYDCGNCR
jgi:hypothetical protein